MQSVIFKPRNERLVYQTFTESLEFCLSTSYWENFTEQFIAAAKVVTNYETVDTAKLKREK